MKPGFNQHLLNPRSNPRVIGKNREDLASKVSILHRCVYVYVYMVMRVVFALHICYILYIVRKSTIYIVQLVTLCYIVYTCTAVYNVIVYSVIV